MCDALLLLLLVSSRCFSPPSSSFFCCWHCLHCRWCRAVAACSCSRRRASPCAVRCYMHASLQRGHAPRRRRATSPLSAIYMILVLVLSVPAVLLWACLSPSLYICCLLRAPVCVYALCSSRPPRSLVLPRSCARLSLALASLLLALALAPRPPRPRPRPRLSSPSPPRACSCSLFVPLAARSRIVGALGLGLGSR